MTIKMHSFILEYFKDFNGAKAAERVGVPARSSKQRAYCWLHHPKVMAEIERQKEEIFKQISVNKGRTMREIARVAFFDIGTLFNEDGTLKNFNELDAETRTCLSKIEFDKDSQSVFSNIKKIYAHDKVKALEMLAKHQNLFADTAFKGTISHILVAPEILKDDELPGRETQE
jgi:phage terminase small subunit